MLYIYLMGRSRRPCCDRPWIHRLISRRNSLVSSWTGDARSKKKHPDTPGAVRVEGGVPGPVGPIRRKGAACRRVPCGPVCLDPSVHVREHAGEPCGRCAWQTQCLALPRKPCSVPGRTLVRGHLEILNLALVAVPNTSCMLPDHMLWTMRASNANVHTRDRPIRTWRPKPQRSVARL